MPDWLATGDGFTRLYAGLGPAIATYCTAKTNSQGCVPVVDAAAGAELLVARPVSDHRAAGRESEAGPLVLRTSGRAAVPFLGGTLCVLPPLQRTPIQTSGGNPPPDDCSGAYLFDFNAWAQGGADPSLVPGQPVDAQFWMRDPAHPDGTGVALSDGIEFDPCP